jgi:chitin synthase
VKALVYGLDKSRLVRLSQEERSYHAFYQFLAGASREERELDSLEDSSQYTLPASSSCYRLPAGLFSDDSMAMDELRAAMKILGFKAKNVASIFSILNVILLLGNIRFNDSGINEQSARIANPEVLTQAANLLGVSSGDFEQAIVNKTNYVRKEVYTVFLDAEGCKFQVNHLASDLYAILFAYLVEMANAKVDTSIQEGQVFNQITLLGGPGFQSRASSGSIGSLAPAPLVAAQGQNSFEEFCVNFANEMVHSYVCSQHFRRQHWLRRASCFRWDYVTSDCDYGQLGVRRTSARISTRREEPDETTGCFGTYGYIRRRQLTSRGGRPSTTKKKTC